MTAAVIVGVFFSILAKGMASPSFSVTSYPEGDLQIKNCDIADTDCIGNVQFKSILVCAPDKSLINGYTYSISLPSSAEGIRVRITPAIDGVPGYTDDARMYGATAATLMTPDKRCREILIRFWSIPEGMSNVAVDFVVTRRFILRDIEVFRTSFEVSHQPIVPAMSPISEASTQSSGEAAESTTEEAPSAANHASLSFRRNMGGLAEAWQCTCLPA